MFVTRGWGAFNVGEGIRCLILRIQSRGGVFLRTWPSKVPKNVTISQSIGSPGSRQSRVHYFEHFGGLVMKSKRFLRYIKGSLWGMEGGLMIWKPGNS